MSILSAAPDAPIQRSVPASPVYPAKRKRDELDRSELDRRPFVIRDPTDPFARPRSYAPICLLSRSQLPLAYLDTAQCGSRVFSAYIQILEECCDHEEVVVLVAKEEKEKRLFAIERVKARTYALCRLQRDVKEEELLRRAKYAVRRGESQRKRRALEVVEKGSPWWQSAAVEAPDVASAAGRNAILPRLAMQRVMEAPQKVTADRDNLGIGNGPLAGEIQDLETALPQADTELFPDAALEDLTKHYMDALYISKASLAFFAKGPLSRARAAFSAEEGNVALAHLVDFLRQSILSSTALDKKFKDALPELIKELSALSVFGPPDVAKRKNSKKKWKAKRSKAGFFVWEDGYVERWWRSDEMLTSPETVDDGLKRRLPAIRMRETFLQVILIMEVVALEASAGYKELPTDSQPAGDRSIADESQLGETQSEETQGPTQAKKPKPKKKQDLAALLETLLDKLCIWHSLEAMSPAKVRQGGADEESSDILKSFCLEVVVPFYASRIPQQAALVNKKLGGPSPPSPRRHSTSAIRKPGEPALRLPPEKRPREPLKRVSTEVHNRRDKHPPSLHRSATDTDAFAHIKREPSESPSMSSVPSLDNLNKLPQPRRQRQNLLEQLNSKQRAIDITAMSKASEARLRKRAEKEEAIEKMKAAAISGIKKPNRSLAGKEVADSTEERVEMAEKKGARLQQRGSRAEAESLTRSAPRATEQHDAYRIVATPSRFGSHRRRTAPAAVSEEAPPSSVSVVPSSSTRVRARVRAPAPVVPDDAALAVTQTGHGPRHLNAIEDTPSRGFAKYMPPGLAFQAGTGTLESPIARRTSAMVQATPMKAALTFKMPQATPLRTSGIRFGPAATPVRSADRALNGGQAMGDEERSIYAALGWEDDGYEELA